MSNAERVAKSIEGIPTVGTLVAQFLSANDDGTVQVDFGSGPVTIYSAGTSTPLAGASVRVLRLNGFTLMLGVVRPQPAFGVVVATGTPNLTVLLPDGSEAQMGYLTSYLAPAINDTVRIIWDGGPTVIGSLAEVPVSTFDPTTSGGGAAVTSAPEFVARDSGNFYTGGGWNYDDPWSSASNTGAFFYNDIAGTIPDGASISLVEVYVTEIYNQRPSVLARVGLHSLAGKSGNPGIRDAAPISAGSGWKVLPNAFGDALKTGAALGVGFPSTDGSSYHKFRGRGGGSSEGLLRITYTI